MKLRIRGNSIRLRLTRSEIAQLQAAGSVVERVEFGDAYPVFSYQLITVTDLETLNAKFEDNALSVLIPVERARILTETEQVGIESMQPLGDGNIMRILVEKDFACLKERVHEDDKDAFPNPFALPTGGPVEC